MNLSDPIGDMIARIKNAQMRNHKKVDLPSSNVLITEVIWFFLFCKRALIIFSEPLPPLKIVMFILIYIFKFIKMKEKK